MRTTITLEKDVAARIERLRRKQPFKDLINEALRLGLEQLEGAKVTEPDSYTIEAVRGEPRRTDLDNVSEVLAELEGDAHR